MQKSVIFIQFAPNSCIVNGASTDKEAIHHSPTSISASDVDGKFNIQVSIPHEDHDVTASITTDTVHEHNYANFISSNTGIFLSFIQFLL